MSSHVLTLPQVATATRAPAQQQRRRRIAGPSLVAVALALLVLVVACALAPGWIAPYAPTAMRSDAILQGPGLAHWFGTDQFGRDVLSLVVHGARQSVLIGVAAVLLSGTVGVALGLAAGYAGGWLDAVLMRLTDVWMAIPNLLLAIAIATALRPSLANTILAISIAAVPRYTRVLRGQAVALRGRSFVEAARAAGASHWAILRGHILPHCSATILVLATLGVGTSILVGASLSFLGIGVNDEAPDWGYLLTQGRGYLSIAWWTVTFPGLAITTLVVSINLLGDALRRKLDGRQEHH
ncbi:ABC transporter permease [Pelomonas sp. KK5]|uniref:ABC transporter permease n=1 Tax=Pelomonas sp. KK5 TaxID=1855730 RepID=UPI00097BF842|nr:ABC transporter permease [Pelomonas sp. KK5]